MKEYIIKEDGKEMDTLGKILRECLTKGYTGEEIVIKSTYDFAGKTLSTFCGKIARKLVWRYNKIIFVKE